MKKTLLVSALTAICVSGYADIKTSNAQFVQQANMSDMMDQSPLMEAFDQSGDHPALPAACAEIKLTADQSTALHKAMFDAKRAEIQNKANLKIAMLDYVNNLVVSDGTLEKAQDFSAKLKEAVGTLVDSKTSFHNQVYFSILTADQRVPALACEKAMMKERKHKGVDQRHMVPGAGEQQGADTNPHDPGQH